MTATYTYRADQLRHSKTVDGVVTTHVWDRGHIVAERDTNGTVFATFNRGLGGQLISTGQQGQVFSYLHDGRGSVLGLLGTDGTLVDSYRFDAFGNESGNSGSAIHNPFRFNGEYTDFETGFQYLRNRYYNPVTGRFITADPFFHALHGNLQSCPIQAGNLFMFVGHNPVRFVDPSGLFRMVRLPDGSYRIEGFTGGNAAAATITSLIPAGGALVTRRPHQIRNRNTVVGEGRPLHGHTTTRAGTIFSLDSSIARDVIVDGIVYGIDTMFDAIIGVNYTGTVLFSLWTAGAAGDRAGHSSTILGLMEILNIDNNFADLASLMNQVLELDAMIMANPRYFYTSSSRVGNFYNSQFLQDLAIYRMSPEDRRNALLSDHGILMRNTPEAQATFERRNSELEERIQQNVRNL